MQFNSTSIAAQKRKIVNPAKHLLMTQRTERNGKKASDNLLSGGKKKERKQALFFVSSETLSN